MTDYPVTHNCNFSAREDGAGRLVWQAIQLADAGGLDPHDLAEGELIASLERLEEALEESADDDSAEAGNACRAAEEAVAKALRGTRVWFLDAYCGTRYDAPTTAEAMDRCEWHNRWPVIDRDGELTGEVSEGEDGFFNVDDDAMIPVSEAVAGGWRIDRESGYASPPRPVIVEIADCEETIRICGGLEQFASMEHPAMEAAVQAYHSAAAEALARDPRAVRLDVRGPRGRRVLHSQWMGAKWGHSSGAIGVMSETLTDEEKAAIDAADDAGRTAAKNEIEAAGGE